MVEPKVVSVRIPPGVLKLIEIDIHSNEEYINRTEWIMDAIRMHLDRRIQTGAIQRDLPGGGVNNSLIFFHFFNLLSNR